MRCHSIEHRRRRLARTYELVSTARVDALGYGEAESYRRKWNSMARIIEHQFLGHYCGQPPSWRLLLRKFSSRRTMPDFAVIGPVKSGTSDLAVTLMLHPNVMTPLSKEFYLPDPNQWKLLYPTERQKRRHSERFGAALSPFLAPYLHWMELPYALAKIRPEMKIVITLRDPVARLHSHWKWEMFLSGRHKANSFPFLSTFHSYVDRALALFPEYPMYTACGYQPIQQSIYWKAVRHWIDCFGRSNVSVMAIEEYFRDQNGFLDRLQEFIGLRPASIQHSGNPINENPLRLPPADDASLFRLRQFFDPHNERLWNVIGERFNW